MNDINQLTESFSSLSSQKKVAFLGDMFNNQMSADEKKKARNVFQGLSPDNQFKLWRLIIGTISIMLCVGICALAIGIFYPASESTLVSGEILLSIITAGIGFFGGLFSDKPVSSGS